jgi:putative flippase GtrA
MTIPGRDLLRFGMVGSLGFVIDLGILAALVHGAAWSPFAARAVAMTVAILCTWLLHRYWTFAAGRMRSALPQSLLYGVVQLAGVSVNYSIFSVLVLTGGVWRLYPVLAAAVGSLSAMAITYVLSKRIAFAEPGVVDRRRMEEAKGS